MLPGLDKFDLIELADIADGLADGTAEQATDAEADDEGPKPVEFLNDPEPMADCCLNVVVTAGPEADAACLTEPDATLEIELDAKPAEVDNIAEFDAITDCCLVGAP